MRKISSVDIAAAIGQQMCIILFHSSARHTSGTQVVVYPRNLSIMTKHGANDCNKGSSVVPQARDDGAEKLVCPN